MAREPAPLQRQRGLQRVGGRLARHVGWARRQGLGRLLEEDQLDPVERIVLASQKARWRRTHHIAPNAVPVFVVGVQRSGTNMLVRGLERSPAFEVRNENDRSAFDRFLLRDDRTIRGIVEGSQHAFVLFKPLCDSHRVADLLDKLGTPSAGRAIWAYRAVDGRARSAVGKFGPEGLRALKEVAGGKLDVWQAGGLSDERLAELRGFDLGSMTPETAAALFWYLRNSLYFDLGLVDREDVLLASYERFVADPQRSMGVICGFLGSSYDDRLVGHVDARSAAVDHVEIDPAVRERCEDLHARLEAALDASWTRNAGGGAPSSVA